MALMAITSRRSPQAPHLEPQALPHPLRELRITEAGHVWCSGITYLPLARGFCYLTAIMD